jgi:hypothetical protein
LRAPRLWLLILGGAGGAAGCGVNNPTYFTPPTGAIESGQPDAGAEIASVVVLPFRSPTDDERARLSQDSDALGFKAPWLRREHVAISIQYSITNLDKQPGKVQVFVDGANEFTNYDRAALQAAAQAAAMNNDRVIVLPLLQTIPVEVAPGETRTGTIREDDFAEAELDLDAIGRWMAPPAAVLINASEVNPIGLERVPPNEVVPAMFQLDVALVAEQHMRLDFLVRVRDSRDRLLDLAHAGDAYAPKPMGYTPPPPMMMAP